MTDQELMQLARNVGMAVREVGVSFTVVADGEEMQRFATIVADREREECARVCDELEEHYSDYAATALLNGDIDLSNAASGEPRACRAIKDAIRTRNNKENQQ